MSLVSGIQLIRCNWTLTLCLISWAAAFGLCPALAEANPANTKAQQSAAKNSGRNKTLSDDKGRDHYPPDCDTEADLIAVVYVADAPQRSFAMVGQKSGAMVQVGSVFEGKRVYAIRPRSLWLSDDTGGSCWLRLAHEGPQKVNTKSRRRNNKAKRRRNQKKNRKRKR